MRRIVTYLLLSKQGSMKTDCGIIVALGVALGAVLLSKIGGQGAVFDLMYAMQSKGAHLINLNP